ncbi:MAG: UDP-N-acetylglucosamine pyrophosphorylase [Bacilli bacterium]|nr:UDP-N-acetylglucosamine pyrophosphorylase [Bacilli bacterium]
MNIDVKEIVDINHTLSKDYFFRYDNIEDIISNINSYVIELGNRLDKNKYRIIGDNIWVGNDVMIDDSVKIIGPCIIDDGSFIKHGAYIREGVIIGKRCEIGNSCEVKNSIIFDDCFISHFNYVGDSIIGYKSHMGAGSVITNLRLDKKDIIIKNGNEIINTNLNKMGAIIGSSVEIGANSVICPGTIIGSNSIIYPLVKVSGVISANSFIKDSKKI